ncbi:MAG: phosphodiester glycosidase family protein, partial [Treponema sp.]|nr:phosphodiester glycosidase family protein [Treponema sp.]
KETLNKSDCRFFSVNYNVANCPQHKELRQFDGKCGLIASSVNQHFPKSSFFKHLSLIPIFLLLLSVFSCSTNTNIDFYADETFEKEKKYLPSESGIVWQKIDSVDWAEYFYFENPGQPIRYHCVKINLSNPKISIKTFPGTENDFTHKKEINTGYFTGVTAKEFSEKTGSKIVVNTAPFSGKNGKRRICGVHIANKTELSKPIERYAAITFTKNQNEEGYTAKIIRNQHADAFTDCDFAFGGFFQILSDSKKISDFADIKDSRTALGLSEDKKTLYILVVEGERKSKSTGLSYNDCADIFLCLNVADALQMDGGGSSSLFINGRNILSYSTLRKNAVFLGFY